MMQRMLMGLAAGVAALSAMPSSAHTIIDFNAYGSGTGIASQYSGVTFGTTNETTKGSASMTDYIGYNGVLTAALVNSTNGGSNRAPILDILFANGASAVSFDYSNYGTPTICRSAPPPRCRSRPAGR